MTKEKFAWTGFGVPLKWLAELDEIPSLHALADAFGDRYLYRYNPVFSGIRDAVVAFGYGFSSSDTPLWRDYQSLSLAALHRILSSRTIPYLDTAATVRRLIEARPELRLPPHFITSCMRSNHVFHESAHCVAHSILQQSETELRSLAPDESDRFVLEAILAESFANTVESLGSVFHHLPISDSIFFPLNSYFSPEPKREEILNRAAAECGPELRFLLLFLSHFEANLAAGTPSDSVCDRIAESAGCSEGAAGLAREIADIGFKLNAGFRESTTPAYFELLGYTREYHSLARSVWLSQPRNGAFVREIARHFHQAAGKV